jgi:hypothetical protein
MLSGRPHYFILFVGNEFLKTKGGKRDIKMIYEICTYDLVPGSVPEVEKRFGAAYEYRKKYSELAGFWHTDVGPLNEVIHIWPYKDLAELEKIKAQAGKDPNWPPKIDFLVKTRFWAINLSNKTVDTSVVLAA